MISCAIIQDGLLIDVQFCRTEILLNNLSGKRINPEFPKNSIIIRGIIEELELRGVKWQS